MSWELIDLLDVCDFQGGTQPPKSEWSKELKNGFVRMVQIRDFTQGKSSYVEYVKDTKNLKKCVPEDIMIGRYGASIGKILTGISGAYNVALVKTIPSLKLDRNYFFHYLNTDYFQNFIKNAGSRAAQAGFNKEELKTLQIPLPPLPIQKRIAEILDAADALKRKDQELLKKYDELAQAIFIDMFGDPVKNEKGWEVKKLPNITENLNSFRKPVKSDDRLKMQGKYPYYGATGIIDYVDDYTHNGELVLISEDGKNLIGRYKKVAFIAIGKFWVNNHSHVLKCKENCCSEYLEFYFNKIDISAYVTGIDQFKLNKNNLDLIPILLPPIALQKRFKIIINEIECLKTKLISSMSENLFNSLIQKAFKGELVA